MSVEASRWALRQRGLTPIEFRVLAHLAFRHHPLRDRMRPDLKALAAACEVSDRRLREALGSLVDKGLLVLAGGKTQGRKGALRTYAFPGSFDYAEMSKSAEVDPGKMSKSAEVPFQNRDSFVPEPCRNPPKLPHRGPYGVVNGQEKSAYSDGEAGAASSDAKSAPASPSLFAREDFDENETESVRQFAKMLHEYPRQGDHRAARKRWDRLDPDADLIATMHAALAWQAAPDGPLCTEDVQFVPTFASWLRSQRWEDEP